MYYEFIILVVQYLFIWRVNWRQKRYEGPKHGLSSEP